MAFPCRKSAKREGTFPKREGAFPKREGTFPKRGGTFPKGEISRTIFMDIKKHSARLKAIKLLKN
jgi:hypothetical protein